MGPDMTAQPTRPATGPEPTDPAGSPAPSDVPTATAPAPDDGARESPPAAPAHPPRPRPPPRGAGARGPPPPPPAPGFWPRLGNPPRSPLWLGFGASVVLLVGSVGGGGTLIHDPILTNTPLGFWRYGHGKE